MAQVFGGTDGEEAVTRFDLATSRHITPGRATSRHFFFRKKVDGVFTGEDLTRDFYTEVTERAEGTERLMMDEWIGGL
jgi:hypothetical protein